MKRTAPVTACVRKSQAELAGMPARLAASGIAEEDAPHCLTWRRRLVANISAPLVATPKAQERAGASSQDRIGKRWSAATYAASSNDRHQARQAAHVSADNSQQLLSGWLPPPTVALGQLGRRGGAELALVLGGHDLDERRSPALRSTTHRVPPSGASPPLAHSARRRAPPSGARRRPLPAAPPDRRVF